MLQKAAAGDIPEAMYNLAVHYQRGEGVAQDLTVGFDYFLQAANADFAPAMHQVALCYIDGKGVSKSTDEAKLWLQKAAQKITSQPQNCSIN